MKDTLFWNNLHNQLRIAQGIPQPVPVYPQINSTAQEILDFTTDTIFHVANQTGAKEAVHLFVHWHWPGLMVIQKVLKDGSMAASPGQPEVKMALDMMRFSRHLATSRHLAKWTHRINMR